METQNSPSEWEKIAIYIADCEAATTAHLAALKSSSKSELKRHQSICQTLLDSIKAEYLVKQPSKKDSVIARLEQAIKDANREI